MLSGKELREIVMDSDSDEDKYYDSATEVEEAHPPSTSQPPSSDYFSSSSEDEVNVGDVTGKQPQPSQWTQATKPRRRVVQTFTGPHNGICSESKAESTPIAFLLLYFAEILLCWLWRRIATTTS